MRSVAELKKRLALATAQGKDHRRSAMIRAMRTRLREQVSVAIAAVGLFRASLALCSPFLL